MFCLNIKIMDMAPTCFTSPFPNVLILRLYGFSKIINAQKGYTEEKVLRRQGEGTSLQMDLTKSNLHYADLSRLHPRPDFINEALPGLFLFLLPCGLPCPQAQEAQHVHFVDFLHPPAILHQFVIGGVDVFRQGQASCGIVTSGFSASARICSASCTAGIVGKVSSTSVVWVWVAISASAMSCIRRSAG